MKHSKIYNFGITDSDAKHVSSFNISEDELLKQIEILSKDREFLSVKEPATLENKGVKSLDLEFFKSALDCFDNSKKIELINVIPAAGAASRQFQLLKTIYFNPVFEECISLNEVSELNEKLLSSADKNQAPLFKEVKESLPSFWNGIVERKFAFLSDLSKVLEANNLSLEQLVLDKEIKTIIKFIIEPCGLNYKNLPKALLKFHSYKGDRERLALEEHIRLCILTNKNNKKAKIHFIISSEHTPFFLEALSEIKKQESFIAFCNNNNFDIENLEVTHSYQEKSTDTVSLDKSSNKIARDENGNILFRKSGHGALLNNINSLKACGLWLQNIDNILFDNPDITNLSVTYKRLMAGVAIKLKGERDVLLNKLKDSDKIEGVIDESIKFLTENFGIKVERKTDKLQDLLQSLALVLDRPIVVGGYVPLKPGQKGGGPFIISEELKGINIYKINTVEGGEFIDGQDNPIFSNAKFFNPVNFFILKIKADGSYYNLNDCLDEKRYFVSTKSDLKGNLINALERPGLWNGSISKALQISIPIPENLFSAVKTVSGNESFLSPLHQKNSFKAFTENDLGCGVVNQEIASFCNDYNLY